jgi:hypothetical protein
VNVAPRRVVAIDEPLPGGCVVVEAGGAEFATISRDTGLLSLSADKLAPGIYQYSYLLRAVVGGRYGMPATTARLADGELVGAGNAATIEVGTR